MQIVSIPSYQLISSMKSCIKLELFFSFATAAKVSLDHMVIYWTESRKTKTSDTHEHEFSKDLLSSFKKYFSSYAPSK